MLLSDTLVLTRVKFTCTFQSSAPGCVPDWGIKLTPASGCSTGQPAYVVQQAGTTTYARVDFIPQSGTMNLATVSPPKNFVIVPFTTYTALQSSSNQCYQRGCGMVSAYYSYLGLYEQLGKFQSSRHIRAFIAFDRFCRTTTGTTSRHKYPVHCFFIIWKKTRCVGKLRNMLCSFQVDQAAV